MTATPIQRWFSCCWLLWVACTLLAFARPALAQPARLAVADFVGDEQGQLAETVRQFARQEAAKTTGTVRLLDQDLTHAALRGAGYQGSVNLEVGEARALGESLGCDVYVLGRALFTRRQGDQARSYYEALLGLFWVETRSGALLRFIFLRGQSENEMRARQELIEQLHVVWPELIATIDQAQQRHHAIVAQLDTPEAVLAELPREILTDDQVTVSGGALPVFYQRVKPEYAAPAAALELTATVELAVVFEANGQVGEIHVRRWAGFGLDEAAQAAAKKLRFKPAQQAEKAVPIRGLVRYNFRRPPTLAERQTETERLKNSLRTLPNPGTPRQSPRP